MAVRPEPRSGASEPPAEFVAAVESMHRARLRPEVSVEEMPAPQRIAPFATALSGDVTLDDLDVATGRIILLHDPAGNDAWGGTFRCVAYVRADVEPEMLRDDPLGAVGWSWLTEALDAHQASYAAASGTVTQVATESFGSMSEDTTSAQIEIRASWTPTDEDFVSHVEAWAEVLCQAAGLEPVPEGVALMPNRRGQRG